MRLLVTVAGLVPGAPLAAATALADVLDTRRVPLTLLVGPRPHPEVAAWTAARRRTGDAVLLHGTRPDPVGPHPTGSRSPSAGPRRPESRRPESRRPDPRPYHRLPAHEAGLRLAGALRAAEACARGHAGSGVDGFAAPGWACSEGVRQALVAAGLDLLVDDEGVHRLPGDGAAFRTPGEVLLARSTRLRPGNSHLRPGNSPLRPGNSHLLSGPRLRSGSSRPRSGALQHVHVVVDGAGDRGDARPGEVEALVDRALAAGALPATAPGVLPAAAPLPGAFRAAGRGGDPERWSITA